MFAGAGRPVTFTGPVTFSASNPKIPQKYQPVPWNIVTFLSHLFCSYMLYCLSLKVYPTLTAQK